MEISEEAEDRIVSKILAALNPRLASLDKQPERISKIEKEIENFSLLDERISDLVVSIPDMIEKSVAEHFVSSTQEEFSPKEAQDGSLDSPDSGKATRIEAQDPNFTGISSEPDGKDSRRLEKQSFRLTIPGDSVAFDADIAGISGKVATIRMTPQDGKAFKIEEFEYPVTKEKLISWSYRYFTYKSKCLGAKITPADMTASFDKRSMDVLRRLFSKFSGKNLPRSQLITDHEIQYVVEKFKLQTSEAIEERKLSQLEKYLEDHYPAAREFTDPTCRVYSLFELMDTYLDENNMQHYLEIQDSTKLFRERIVQIMIAKIEPKVFRGAVERKIALRPDLKYNPRALEQYVIDTAEKLQSTWDVFFPEGEAAAVSELSGSLNDTLTEATENDVENKKANDDHSTGAPTVTPAPHANIKCIACGGNHFFGIQMKGKPWQQNCPKKDIPMNLLTKYKLLSIESIESAQQKKGMQAQKAAANSEKPVPGVPKSDTIAESKSEDLSPYARGLIAKSDEQNQNLQKELLFWKSQLRHYGYDGDEYLNPDKRPSTL